MSLLNELLASRQQEVQKNAPDDEELEVLVDQMNDASEDLDDIVTVNKTLTDAVVALESIVDTIDANPNMSPVSQGILIDRTNRILSRVGVSDLAMVSMEDEGEKPGGLKAAIVDRIKKIAQAAKNSAGKVLEGLGNFWEKIGNSANAAGKRAAQLQEMLKNVPSNDFEFTLSAKYRPALKPAAMSGLLATETEKILSEYSRGIDDAFQQLKSGNEVIFRFKTIQPSDQLPGKPHFIPVGSVAKLEWDKPENGKDPVTFNVGKPELDTALSNVRSVMGAILKFRKETKDFPKEYMAIVEKIGNADDTDNAKATRQQLEQVVRVMDYTVKRWTTYAGTQATLVLKVASTAMQEKREPNEREGENKGE